MAARRNDRPTPVFDEDEAWRGFADSLPADECFDGLVDALRSTEPVVGIRLNPRKAAPDIAAGRAVAWCPEGRVLDSRPSFTLDPALHQGRYYVQEPSSMFIAHVLPSLPGALDRPLTYLDACAAPGGKTTAALSLLPEGSTLVANEFAPARAAVLRENLMKWGDPRVVVTNAAAEAFGAAGPLFDIVAADVPCSGEGMMRKDPVALAQWSPRLVEECAARQRAIVRGLWKALRPGGFMIYSTCTFNRRENEDILLGMLADNADASCVAVAAPPEWGIAGPIDGGGVEACRFIPGRIAGEGLFMAVLRKAGDDGPRHILPRKAREVSPGKAADWLADGDYVWETAPDGVLHATPRHCMALLGALSQTPDVRIIHRGVPVAETKGRDLVPTHALALSTAYRRGAFPEAEVDLETAREYLRRQAVTLPEAAPAGYVLLTYQGVPLGFVKNLGRRANNLYPKSWMIHL